MARKWLVAGFEPAHDGVKVRCLPLGYSPLIFTSSYLFKINPLLVILKENGGGADSNCGPKDGFTVRRV